LDESGDALGMFGIGDAFKESLRGAEDGEAGIGAADEWGEALAVAFAGFAEENGFDAAGGAESFFNEARAFDADGAVFRGKAATEGDAKLLEPAVFAAGEEVGGGGGFGRRGHWRKVSKSGGEGEEWSVVSFQWSVKRAEREVESQKLKVERKEREDHAEVTGAQRSPRRGTQDPPSKSEGEAPTPDCGRGFSICGWALKRKKRRRAAAFQNWSSVRVKFGLGNLRVAGASVLLRKYGGV
jgi:hypothetical protein